jgi:hypothetical protein
MRKFIEWLVSKTSAYKELLRAHEKLSMDFEDVIQKRVTLTDIAARNGTINVCGASEVATLIAAQFLKWLDEEGAVNYLETTFKERVSVISEGREPREVTVTVIRRDGKTPHEIRKELETAIRSALINNAYTGLTVEQANALSTDELIKMLKKVKL